MNDLNITSRMLSVREAMAQRRAVKHFDSMHRMTETETDFLLRNAILSPTAFNLQHWRIVRVADNDLRQRIRDVAADQPQITDASLLLVLCMDLNAWAKDTRRYWANAPSDVQDYVTGAIKDFYDRKEQLQRDEAMRSCGIIAMSVMLLAKEMGYDTCPMDVCDFDAVGGMINLPPDHIVGLLIAVGKGTREPWPRPGQLPLKEVFFTNTF